MKAYSLSRQSKTRRNANGVNLPPHAEEATNHYDSGWNTMQDSKNTEKSASWMPVKNPINPDKYYFMKELKNRSKRGGKLTNFFPWFFFAKGGINFRLL